MTAGRAAILPTAILPAALLLAVAGCSFQRSGPPAPVTMHAEAVGASAAGTVNVAAGDTLYEIARRYNVPVRELIELNGLAPPYTLLIGQRLALPTARFHTVQKGDTLYAVSRLYQVDTAELARANGLESPYRIQIGQQLRLPGANGIATAGDMTAPVDAPVPGRKPGTTMVAAAPVLPVRTVEPPQGEGAVQPTMPSQREAPPPPVVAPVPAPVTVAGGVIPPRPPARMAAAEPAVPVAAPRPAADPNPPPADDPPPRMSSMFAWPVRGEILSEFGPKPGGLHNDGINIAVASGTPVAAAESGVVAYAGNELRGFGNLLLIRHADGWMTAYAHLDHMQVQRGARVTRGQRIGTVGATGNVMSPQLHFEVRKGSRAVDPRDWLSDRTVSRAGDPDDRPDPG